MARILVVDDDPAVLKSVARQLKRWGHTTIFADSARAAAASLAADDVDVLVSDLQMPEMDGFALAALARAMAPKMPIIIMSGTFEDVGVTEGDGIPLIPKADTSGALKAAVERACARLGSPACR